MILDIISQPIIQTAYAHIKDAKHVVVCTHMSPDGDAMGSSLSIYHYLQALYAFYQQDTTVDVIVPNHFPNFLSWMPAADKIVICEVEEEKANSLIRQADFIIATDFNDPKRVGMMGGMIVANSCPKLMIDHHLYPTDFASIAISFPQASSASEMVFRFVYQLQQSYNLPERLISNEVAKCIYTGMMTDTGNFSYNSSDPALYQIVSKLLEKGVTKDVIYNNVFNQFSEDRMRLMGYCLHKKMRIFPEYHTAFISLTRKELYTFNFQSGDAEGIVNLPLQISGIHYSCFMREDKVLPGDHCDDVVGKNKVKISFRSQGDRPVNIFAQEIFNGGGHANAAGGEFYGPINEAVKLFMSEYPKYFNK